MIMRLFIEMTSHIAGAFTYKNKTEKKQSVIFNRTSNDYIPTAVSDKIATQFFWFLKICQEEGGSKEGRGRAGKGGMGRRKGEGDRE